MQDIDSVVRVLTAVKRLGVQVAIDDFGTGYSALSYLKRLPIDVIKIDKTFIHDLICGGAGADITSAIIAMARSLGLTTIAEGVETKEQLAFLRQRGCDMAQGFLFGAADSSELSMLRLLRAPSSPAALTLAS